MDNIDIDEIKRFGAMASGWWDSEGPSALLHRLNPIRVQFITDQIIVRDKSTLDIGCGGGILTETLAKRGAKVTGIDATAALISVAKQHATASQLNEIQYYVTTAEKHAETHSSQYDIITCLELLEHVPQPEMLIKAAAMLVKPGGHLFFSTLNRGLKSYCLTILGAEYCLGLLPKSTHHYEKFIRPTELESYLRHAGLTLQLLKGLKYNPFLQRASLSDDVSVNYLAYARRA